MTKIVDGLKEAAETLSMLGLKATLVGVGFVVAPFVSLVAVPIFALLSIRQFVKHRSLYTQTLTDGSRAKFGRVEGQDYTRWDGKAISRLTMNPTWQERMHELIGSYVHGQADDSFKREPSKQALDSPFKTQEDLNWLKREVTRRETKDGLDFALKMLRAFSKTLIPLVGVIWVLFSETGMGGASQIGCRGCMMANSEYTHWTWARAIKFHQITLSSKLPNSGESC